MKSTFTFTLMMLMAVFMPSTLAFSQEVPFQDGDHLQYTIHYKLGVSVNIAILDVSVDEVIEDNRPAYLVKAFINTNGFGDIFHKTSDLYEATFYANSHLVPAWYRRDVKEKKYWSQNFYSWSRNAATIQMKIDSSTLPSIDESFANKEHYIDIMNVLFRIVSVEFDRLLNGETLRFPTIVDRQFNDVTISMVSREEKKISKNGGTFKTVKLAVSNTVRKDGDNEVSHTPFDSKDRTIYIWVADDDSHVPVYFTLGSIYGRLTNYEGLKYPLSSKIK